jgi:tetratricopeptide (TPR) repeat protein
VYELGKELLAENEKNPIAIQATIAALLELDRQEEAIKLLDDRVDSDESDVAMRLVRANVYLSSDKFDEAIADASKVIELKPEAVEGYFVRCRAYLQRAELNKESGDSEDLTKARRDVEMALDIKPNAAEGIRLRALVSSQQKRYDEAIQDMTLLARNNPQDSLWLLQLATLYQLNDQPSMATKVADQLISMDSKNWRAYRIRGDAKLSVGNQQAATADYKKALEYLDSKDEERSGLLNNLAWILATSTEDDLRDGALSITLGKEACELTDYKEVHILSTLAAGYAESGDFEEAIKWSSKAVELGAKQSHDQLEQLENELKSYREGKPWREKQEVKEIKAPVIRPEETIET